MVEPLAAAPSMLPGPPGPRCKCVHVAGASSPKAVANSNKYSSFEVMSCCPSNSPIKLMPSSRAQKSALASMPTQRDLPRGTLCNTALKFRQNSAFSSAGRSACGAWAEQTVSGRRESRQFTTMKCGSAARIRQDWMVNGGSSWVGLSQTSQPYCPRMPPDLQLSQPPVLHLPAAARVSWRQTTSAFMWLS